MNRRLYTRVIYAKSFLVSTREAVSHCAPKKAVVTPPSHQVRVP